MVNKFRSRLGYSKVYTVFLCFVAYIINSGVTLLVWIQAFFIRVVHVSAFHEAQTSLFKCVFAQKIIYVIGILDIGRNAINL